MGPLAANLASLSFVYAGCVLIMGRSWHTFIANAVWLPLLGIGIYVSAKALSVGNG